MDNYKLASIEERLADPDSTAAYFNKLADDTVDEEVKDYHLGWADINESVAAQLRQEQLISSNLPELLPTNFQHALAINEEINSEEIITHEGPTDSRQLYRTTNPALS